MSWLLLKTQYPKNIMKMGAFYRVVITASESSSL
jgi:hypothetical protein